MEKFSKEIKLNNNKKVSYEVSESSIPIYSITSYSDEDYKKILRFSRSYDYSFKSSYNIDFDELQKLHKESHVIEKENPLYIPFMHLLNGEEELVIDDDETEELNKKYMRIFKNLDSINVDFVYDLSDPYSFDRFHIFVKNIISDNRSKIDCINRDTKDRLYFFFKEVDEMFREDYHQFTTEEYLVNNNGFSLKESKKYVKKFERN